MLSIRRNPLRLMALPLLLLAAACENPVEGHDDHHLDDVVGVEVAGMDGVVLGTYRDGAWTLTSGDALQVGAGEERDVRIVFLAADGDRIELPTAGEEYTLRVEIADPSVVSFEGHGDHGAFLGKAAGRTTVRVQAYHGAHADYQTAPLDVEVTAGGE